MLKKALVASAIATLVTIGSASIANAAVPGFNIGGQLGAGNIQLPSGSKTTFAGRAYIGYLFNQYIGAELGYTGFASVTNAAGKNIQRNAGDLLAKGILPLAGNFNLFAKAGIAYVSPTGNNNSNHWLPAFGAGAGYDITQNVSADVQWLRYQKTGNSAATDDLYTVGVSYYFG